MANKYAFGWRDAAAVECPALDAFIDELVAVCEKYGAGFEMESYSEGGGYLVIVPHSAADFSIFLNHVDEYEGGVPWLDEAKERYKALNDKLSAEYKRQQEIKREADDLATFERLKKKYGVTP